MLRFRGGQAHQGQRWKVTADVLELLVFPGAADFGGKPLGEFVQTAGIFQFDFCLATEKLLQVLQQLDAGFRLLLQAFELLHQLVTDFCPRKTKSTRVILQPEANFQFLHSSSLLWKSLLHTHSPV